VKAYVKFGIMREFLVIVNWIEVDSSSGANAIVVAVIVDPRTSQKFEA